MNPAVLESTLAPHFAFAGRAFLSTDREALLATLNAIEDADGRVAQMGRALTGDAEELEREYVRLFLNPSGTPCPPWQSAHGLEPQLMGAAHHKALAWFQRGGVQPAAGNEPADHAGLLLLYYAKLLEEGADLETLQAFRAEHLIWIVAFSAAVSEETRHPFYRLLAGWTADLIRGC